MRTHRGLFPRSRVGSRLVKVCRHHHHFSLLHLPAFHDQLPPTSPLKMIRRSWSDSGGIQSSPASVSLVGGASGSAGSPCRMRAVVRQRPVMISKGSRWRLFSIHRLHSSWVRTNSRYRSLPCFTETSPYPAPRSNLRQPLIRASPFLVKVQMLPVETMPRSRRPEKVKFKMSICHDPFHRY